MLRGVIFYVCQLEDKAWEAKGVSGENKEGLAVHNEVCAGRGIVSGFLCRGMAEIQSTAAGSGSL